jgi:hypothetical protein
MTSFSVLEAEPALFLVPAEAACVAVPAKSLFRRYFCLPNTKE